MSAGCAFCVSEIMTRNKCSNLLRFLLLTVTSFDTQTHPKHIILTFELSFTSIASILVECLDCKNDQMQHLRNNCTLSFTNRSVGETCDYSYE